MNSQRCIRKFLSWSMLHATPTAANELRRTFNHKRNYVFARSVYQNATSSTKMRNKYKTLTNVDIKMFTDIVGENAIVSDPTELQAFNSDWTNIVHGKSKLVLKPSKEYEVSQILKYCNDNQLSLCIQGGNTGLVHGSVPINDEVILSTSRMNKILNFDELTGALICESGCILQVLDQHVAEYGYTMPLDLGAKGSCQIGGNISTNAGGLHFIRYGSLHGSILGLEVILASGEKLDLMSTMRKDNTGYDLKHLFIGAEGTLGIVTKACVLCPQKPELKSLTLLGLESFNKIGQTYRLAKSLLGEVIHAVEFIDSSSMELVELAYDMKCPIQQFPFYLLIEAAGSANSNAESRLGDFVATAMERELVLDGTITSDSTKMQYIWSLREAISSSGLKAGYQVMKYDLSLPLEHFYTPVEEMRRRMGSDVQHCCGYGHIGDGNLHLNIIVDKKTIELVRLAEPYVYELTSKFRGSISAEHGLGALKNDYIGYSKSPSSVEIMKQLKRLFDPNGILNPGKTLPSS